MRAHAIGCLFVLLVAAADAHGQQFSFREPVILLEAGDPPPATYAIVQAAASSGTVSAGELMLTDVGGSGPSSLNLTFDQVQELQPPPGGMVRYWRVRVSVEGMEPESRYDRTVHARLGAGSGASGGLVDVTLTNVVSGFAWEVTPPPRDLVLGRDEQDRSTSLTIRSGDVPITGLRIVQSTLQDESTKRMLAKEYLHLSAVPIGRRTTQGVTLEVLDGFSAPGTYEGSIVLAVDRTPETKAVNLTVHSSHRCLKLLGTLGILLGVFASWFVAVVVKNQSFRLEGLRAAQALKESLAPFAKRIAAADQKLQGHQPPKMDHLGTLYERADTQLGEKWLDEQGLIPRWFRPASEARAENLKNHLILSAKRVAIVEEIVFRGADVLLRNWPGPGDPREPDFVKALGKLDELADEKNELDKVKASVQQIVTGLPQSSGFGPQPGAPTRIELLTGSLDLLHGAAWVVFFAVTTVVGYLALVYPDLGFGTWEDLLKCFLWGLGLPMAGQQFQQLKPETIATHFAIPYSKTP